MIGEVLGEVFSEKTVDPAEPNLESWNSVKEFDEVKIVLVSQEIHRLVVIYVFRNILTFVLNSGFSAQS